MGLRESFLQNFSHSRIYSTSKGLPGNNRPFAPVMAPVIGPVMEPVMDPVIGPVIDPGPTETRAGTLCCTAHKASFPKNPGFTWMPINPSRVFSPVKHENNRKSVSLHCTNLEFPNRFNGRVGTHEAPLGLFAGIARE
jgi:hypothetical protein